jgi:hypothetical protein
MPWSAKKSSVTCREVFICSFLLSSFIFSAQYFQTMQWLWGSTVLGSSNLRSLFPPCQAIFFNFLQTIGQAIPTACSTSNNATFFF